MGEAVIVEYYNNPENPQSDITILSNDSGFEKGPMKSHVWDNAKISRNDILNIVDIVGYTYSNGRISATDYESVRDYLFTEDVKDSESKLITPIQALKPSVAVITPP